MSQTWVIKDTAPNDLPFLSATTISFQSNNESFSRIVASNYADTSGIHYTLKYDSTQVCATATENSSYTWVDNAYKTVTFETAPTGELLSWLQANADLQKEVVSGIQYQDIHLEDKELWNQLQTAWEQGDYTAALNVLKNASLTDKQLNAATINALTTELLSLQAQSDPSFKTGQIVVASEPPSDLAVDKVYFRLIGPVTDYNEQNAYYIEINQKTSNGYDVLNPATQAENVMLTENTAAKFGFVGVTYTLDKALYDVESLLQIITSS